MNTKVFLGVCSTFGFVDRPIKLQFSILKLGSQQKFVELKQAKIPIYITVVSNNAVFLRPLLVKNAHFSVDGAFTMSRC